MQAANAQITPDVALIAVPANDHIEVKPEQRAEPTEKGGRRKRDMAVPATIVATGDDAPMPRATDKEVRAARKKAEQASRINEMTQGHIDAAKAGLTPGGPDNTTPEPVAVPRETPPAPAPSAAALLNEVRQGEAAQGQTPPPADKLQAAIGPMRGLRERLKAGAYQKMPNGQPANGDEVATALGNLEPLEVVKALMIAFDHTTNIYGHLNVGQQSMNYRNKFRGALKRGELGMGVLREAVEVVLEQRPPAPTGQTPAPAPEQATTTAQDGEPVANPAKVEDPSNAETRHEASQKANASRTPEQRSEAAKKAAATRKAKQGDPRKAQGK